MSPYKPDQHHRRSTRLRGYDYAQVGMYFVTIVTQNRACLFGHVEDNIMQLNDAGRIAESCWLAIPEHFPHVMLDAYIIMPNHVHGIVVIMEYVGASVGAHVGAKNFSPLQHSSSIPQSPSKTVGSIVRGFKQSASPNGFRQIRMFTVWEVKPPEELLRPHLFGMNHP